MAIAAETIKRTQEMTKSEREEQKSKLTEMRNKERVKVKGIFRFHEVPKGEMEFSFKKYAGDQIEKFRLKDGEIYTIPLAVARHLNTNTWYPIYSHSQLNERGDTELIVKEKIRRCSFQSLEFMDINSAQENHI